MALSSNQHRLVLVDMDRRGMAHRQQTQRRGQVLCRLVRALRAIVGSGDDVAGIAEQLDQLPDVRRALADGARTAAQYDGQRTDRRVSMRVDIDREWRSGRAPEAHVHQRVRQQRASLRARRRQR